LQELLNSKPKLVPAVNQIEVHPFNTQPEITSFCAQQNIVVEAYAPLARSLRANHPKIKELSNKYNRTWAQLMVKWSLQKGYVPLPKSVNERRIKANAKVDGFEISDEDLNILDGLDEKLVTDWDPTDAD
jgi:diketogulonate reductase-like aldo/keto reductase